MLLLQDMGPIPAWLQFGAFGLLCIVLGWIAIRAVPLVLNEFRTLQATAAMEREAALKRQEERDALQRELLAEAWREHKTESQLNRESFKAAMDGLNLTNSGQFVSLHGRMENLDRNISGMRDDLVAKGILSERRKASRE